MSGAIGVPDKAKNCHQRVLKAKICDGLAVRPTREGPGEGGEAGR